MKETLRNASPTIAYDTETSGLKWYASEIVGHCLGCISSGDYRGYYIPVRHKRSMCGIDPENIGFVEEAEVELKEFLEDEAYCKILFNGKFDINQARNHGLEINNFEDAMLLMFLRNENEKNHRLKDLARKYVDPESKDEADKVATYVKTHRIFKVPESSYANIPIELLGPYGAKDACLTLALWNKHSKFLQSKEESARSDGIRLSIYTHERDYSRVVADMERVGFPYDVEVGEAIIPGLTLARDRLTEEICEAADRPQMNPGSDLEVRTLMKEKGHVSPRKGKTGQPCWGREELMGLNNEIGEKLACWRNLDHNLTTISEGLPKWGHNGRIYGTYNQIGARTGRASASEPNLQAIPKRLPKYTRVPDYAIEALRRAFGIRKAFKAPPGYSILSIDQSQFELRLLDHYAQDPEMHKAFIEGRDIHCYVGAMLFSMAYDEMVRGYKEGDEEAKRNRDISKEIDFAVVYGAGFKRIKTTLNGYGIPISLNEVRNFYLRYMDIFKEIRAFIDKVQNTVRRRGYLFNHYGRHKRIPSSKAYVGVNHLIQGVTADMLKEIKIRCSKYLDTTKRTKIMLAVHDEIDFLLHDDEHDIIPDLIEIFEDFDWCRTPIVAEVYIGPSWGELNVRLTK